MCRSRYGMDYSVVDGETREPRIKNQLESEDDVNVKEIKEIVTRKAEVVTRGKEIVWRTCD